MTEAQKHLSGIARGGGLGLIGAAISAGTSFALVIVVTNVMSKSDAGQFFSATSLFMITMSVATLGTDAGLSRFTAKFLLEKRGGAVRLCWLSALRAVGIVSVAAALLGVLCRGWIADATGLDASGAELMLTVMALGVPAAAVSSVALSATRALATMRPTVLIDKIARPTAQTALAFAVLTLGGGLVALGVAWTVPYVLAAAASLMVTRKAARKRIRPLTADSDPTPGVTREFWKFTWPRSVAQVSQMTIQRADIILIGALLSPASAAVYTAATRFVAMGQFGTQALQQAMQPRFSHLIAAGETAVLETVYKTSTAWSILVAWPVYLMVGAAPTMYLSLFGGGYQDTGAGVVVAMSIAMMIGVGSGPVDTMLLMSGRSSLSLVNSLVALTIDLTLCLILIPVWGIVGAAVAWNAAVVVRSLSGFVQVRRSTRLSPFSPATFRAAATALGCFGLPILLLNVTGALTLASYLATIVACGLAYAGLLWLQRDHLELTALRSVVRRRAKVSRTGTGDSVE